MSRQPQVVTRPTVAPRCGAGAAHERQTLVIAPPVAWTRRASVRHRCGRRWPTLDRPEFDGLPRAIVVNHLGRQGPRIDTSFAVFQVPYDTPDPPPGFYRS